MAEAKIIPHRAATDAPFKIEKGIPISDRGKAKYPWSDMEIGDSFFSPGADGGRVRAAAAEAGIRRGRKFSTRTVEGGVRVWRIA